MITTDYTEVLPAAILPVQPACGRLDAMLDAAPEAYDRSSIGNSRAPMAFHGG